MIEYTDRLASIRTRVAASLALAARIARRDRDVWELELWRGYILASRGAA